MYIKCLKILHIKVSGKMPYVHSVDPDQTAPVGAKMPYADSAARDQTAPEGLYHLPFH